MKFTCTYPWGSTYSKKLMSFLEVMEIPWTHDPRREGSDCWGFLISTSQEALDVCVADIQKRLEEASACMESWDQASSEGKKKVLESYGFSSDEDIWEHPWGASEKDVVEVSTDWKHLEIDDHSEKLRKVGISMTHAYVKNDEGKQSCVVTIRPL